MDRTGYMIKPEGMPNREQIRQMLLGAGLVIVASTVVRLDQQAADALYGGLPEGFRDAFCAHVMSAEVEIGIIEGENAIARITEITGLATKPAECAPGTVRHTFGQHEPEPCGRFNLWHSAIHRPKNAEEAEHDLAIFARYF